MNKLTLATALASCLLCHSAFAQSRNAAFIGGGAGVAMSEVAQEFGSSYYSSVSSSDDANTGLKLYGGYMWGNFGVEIGYYDFGSYQVAGGFNNSVADEFATSAWAISAVGSVPLGRTVSLNGKLGLAPVTTKYKCMKGCTNIPNTDTNSLGVLFGIGVAWHVNPNFLIRADWDALGGAKAAGYVSPTNKQEATYTYSMLTVSLEARF